MILPVHKYRTQQLIISHSEGLIIMCNAEAAISLSSEIHKMP